MKQLPEAILFDADGTLFDSEPLQYEATRLAVKDLHDFDFTWELYETHMLRGSKAGHEVLVDIGIEPVVEEYQALKQDYYATLVKEKLTVMPGIVEFLQWCQAEDIKCAVVSASRLSQVKSALAAVSIQKFFQVIVSGDDTRSTKKPHPFPFELAVKRINVKPAKAIAVEDTAKGITSARAAGLRCVGIRNDTNNNAELAEADVVISHYKELQDFLLK